MKLAILTMAAAVAVFMVATVMADTAAFDVAGVEFRRRRRLLEAGKTLPEPATAVDAALNEEAVKAFAEEAAAVEAFAKAKVSN